jgi:hypothetical protein
MSLTQAQLTFGAAKSPTGSISQYGKGIIHRCIL